MRYLIILLFLLFSACSTTTPPNQWQYQAQHSYKNFERYYLENKEDLAVVELHRAISSASKSSDLEMLATIELSTCALKVALLQPFTCKGYRELEPLINSASLESYAAFLEGTLETKHIGDLPKQYQDFAIAKSAKNLEAMQEEITDMDSPISKMIAGSLIQNELSLETIEHIGQSVAFYGYQLAVLQWLSLEIKKNSDIKKIDILKKKLDVLQSNTHK